MDLTLHQNFLISAFTKGYFMFAFCNEATY
jgi:hypothetical protein